MRKFKRKVVFFSILAVFFVSVGFYTCYKLFNKPTDKVEQWMKIGLLIFEPNTKIDFCDQEESEPKLEAS